MPRTALPPRWGRRRVDPEARRLDAILRRSDLEVSFQPITDLITPRVIAMEALTRPRVGFPNASALFAAASALGRGPDLDSAARACIIESSARLPRHLALFVNISPTTLASPDGVERIWRDLAPSAARCVLEITEHAVDGDAAGEGRVADAAEALRDRGFQIALDDLGAGNADLRRLVDLRPDWIKVDRALVCGVEQDSGRQRLIESLLGFASGLGIRVIAEGVERASELTCLRSLGVRYVQGYLLARPSRSHHAAARIATRHVETLAA